MPGNTKKHRRGNGEGSIYQRSDGTWAAVLTVGVKPDGKPKRKFYYGKTRKEVAEKLRDAQNKLSAGVLPGNNNVLFGKWILNWLENVIRPGIKERTYKNYSTSIKVHIVPGLGHYKLKDLSEEIIQEYLNEQAKTGNQKKCVNEDTGEIERSNGPVAPSSLIQQRRLIIAALEYAVEKNRLFLNPGKKTKRPKASPKTMDILTDEEMNTLATKGVKYRYYAAYMLTMTTGCRRGEILGLGWKFVDIGIPWAAVDRFFPWDEIRKLKMWDTEGLRNVLEAADIYLGYGYIRLVYQMVDDSGKPYLDELKTDLSHRTLIITEEMVLLLIFWRMQQNKEQKAKAENKDFNKDNLVFCTRKGTYIYPRNFTKLWSENLKSMGLDHKRFHDLRHTVATVMLEDGEAMTTVQEQMGHYDAGFTASRYGHVTPKMRTGAADKLGERLKNARTTKEPDNIVSIHTKGQIVASSAACKIK